MNTKNGIIITLIFLTVFLIICYVYIKINKNSNNDTKEKVYKQEIKNETSEINGIKNKNKENTENIQKYNHLDLTQSENNNEPRIGMTKEQVLNTLWGKPDNIDYGGTFADKNNKKRTNGEWDEAWYYKRKGKKIFIYFKNNKVVKIYGSK